MELEYVLGAGLTLLVGLYLLYALLRPEQF